MTTEMKPQQTVLSTLIGIMMEAAARERERQRHEATKRRMRDRNWPYC